MPQRLTPVRCDEERNRLVEQWSGLVPFVLRRFRGDDRLRRYGDECRSAAHLALLRAAELWREDGGAKFNSYAVQAIYRLVCRAAARQGRLRAREVPFLV